MDGLARKKVIAEVERLESLAQWWAEQAAHIERDRRQLQMAILAGCALAGGSCLYNWRIGVGALAILALAWIQGMYLCTVHRWEYAYNLREARRDLWMSRKALTRPAAARAAAGAGAVYRMARVPPHPLFTAGRQHPPTG